MSRDALTGSGSNFLGQGFPSPNVMTWDAVHESLLIRICAAFYVAAVALKFWMLVAFQRDVMIPCTYQSQRMAILKWQRNARNAKRKIGKQSAPSIRPKLRGCLEVTFPTTPSHPRAWRALMKG